MIDIKKANKQELMDILHEEAMLIEDSIAVDKRLRYEGENGYDYPLFMGVPERKMQICIKFFMRLAEVLKPEIAIITREMRQSEYSKRRFYVNLCGHEYEIFMLYSKEEAEQWNLDF